MAMRHRPDEPLAARAAAIEAGHLGGQPGLVEKNEPGRIHIALPDLPAAPPAATSGRSCSAALRLFFYAARSEAGSHGSPPGTTDTPRCCRNSCWISARVMS